MMVSSRGIGSHQGKRPGAPEWIDEPLLRELDGRLWHATNERGWAGIVAAGAIRADATAIYRNGFCRSIGAVSLFDLAYPDCAASPAASHWSTWLDPGGVESRFWIEIDRERTIADVLGPSATLAKWRVALEEGSSNLRLIAGLEAAHIGPLPLANTVRTLEIRQGRWIRDALRSS